MNIRRKAFFIRVKASAKCLNLGKYSEADFEKDLLKLQSLGYASPGYEQLYVNRKRADEDRTDTAFGGYKRSVKYDNQKTATYIYEIIQNISKRNPNMVSSMFMKLGYDYMRDPGFGIISADIDSQTVFFTPSSYDIVDSAMYSYEAARYKEHAHRSVTQTDIYNTLNDKENTIDDVIKALDDMEYRRFNWILHCGNFKRFSTCSLDELIHLADHSLVKKSIVTILNKNNLLLCINRSRRLNLLDVYFFDLIGGGSFNSGEKDEFNTKAISKLNLHWINIIPKDEVEVLFDLISSRLLQKTKEHPDFNWKAVYSVFKKQAPIINSKLKDIALSSVFSYSGSAIDNKIPKGVIHNIKYTYESESYIVKIKPSRYCFIIYETFDSLITKQQPPYKHEYDNIYSGVLYKAEQYYDLLVKYDTIYLLDSRYPNEVLNFITDSNRSKVEVVRKVR